jgi:hypothetical protein
MWWRCVRIRLRAFLAVTYTHGHAQNIKVHHAWTFTDRNKCRCGHTAAHKHLRRRLPMPASASHSIFSHHPSIRCPAGGTQDGMAHLLSTGHRAAPHYMPACSQHDKPAAACMPGCFAWHRHHHSQLHLTRLIGSSAALPQRVPPAAMGISLHTFFVCVCYQGGGLPQAGHTQRNQENPTAGSHLMTSGCIAIANPHRASPPVVIKPTSNSKQD